MYLNQSASSSGRYQNTGENFSSQEFLEDNFNTSTSKAVEASQFRSPKSSRNSKLIFQNVSASKNKTDPGASGPKQNIDINKHGTNMRRKFCSKFQLVRRSDLSLSDTFRSSLEINRFVNLLIGKDHEDSGFEEGQLDESMNIIAARNAAAVASEAAYSPDSDDDDLVVIPSRSYEGETNKLKFVDDFGFDDIEALAKLDPRMPRQSSNHEKWVYDFLSSAKVDSKQQKFVANDKKIKVSSSDDRRVISPNLKSLSKPKIIGRSEFLNNINESDFKIDSSLPLPKSLTTEALVESIFLDNSKENHIIQMLGDIISQTNDLYSKMAMGSYIKDNVDGVRMNLDAELDKVISGILESTVSQLDSVIGRNLIAALEDASLNGEFSNSAKKLLEVSRECIKRLILFLDNKFPAAFEFSLQSSDKCRIVTLVLDEVLDYYDASMLVIWRVCTGADEALNLHSSKSKIGSAVDNEINELRRIKSSLIPIEEMNNDAAVQGLLLSTFGGLKKSKQSWDEKSQSSRSEPTGGEFGTLIDGLLDDNDTDVETALSNNSKKISARKSKPSKQDQAPGQPLSEIDNSNSHDQKEASVEVVENPPEIRFEAGAVSISVADEGISLEQSSKNNDNCKRTSPKLACEMVRMAKEQQSALMKQFNRVSRIFKRHRVLERFKRWVFFSRLSTFRVEKIRRLFARIQNLENKMSSKYFHHWKSNSTMKKSTEIHSNESAKLKLRICELESQIANLSNTNDLAAALIAERVLNRELLSINTNLRYGLQAIESEWSELKGIQSERNMQAEYVVRRREEELAETKRSLQCFIDAVKSPNEDKINYSDKSKDGGLFPSKVSPDNNYQSELPAKKHNVAPSLSNLVPPIPNVQSSRDLFDDSRSAMKILLLESQRLRKGLSFADEHISLLQKQLEAGKARNSENLQTILYLERKISRHGQSQQALKVLLEKKLGEEMVLNLVEILNSEGAGSTALLG